MISLEDIIRINEGGGIKTLAGGPIGRCRIRNVSGKTVTADPDSGWYIIKHGYGRKQEIYFCRGGQADKQIRIEADEIQAIGNLPLFWTWDKVKGLFRTTYRIAVINMITGDIAAEYKTNTTGLAVKSWEGGGHIVETRNFSPVRNFSFDMPKAPAPFINPADLPAVQQAARDKKIPCSVGADYVAQVAEGMYNIAYFKDAHAQRRVLTDVLRLDASAKTIEEWSGVARIARLDIKTMPDDTHRIVFNQALLYKRAEEIIAINELVRARR